MMARFSCNDCVNFDTDACRFGVNHRDYSSYCDDMLVEQNHAYNKAIDDFANILNKYFNKQNNPKSKFRPTIVLTERDAKDIIEQLKVGGEYD